MISLLDRLAPYSVVSVIGMAKNAGKTTVVNHLIDGFGSRGLRLALTSIGRDGEDVDIVTKTKKPRIFVPEGSIVVTAERLLGLCDITLEILRVADFNTPMGRVVVVRALSAGFVQLGGPSITGQMAELLDGLRGLGIDKIIIDGAVSRKSLASPKLAEAAVLCAGASSPRMDKVISETRHAVEMLTLPPADEAALYIPGAISDAKIEELISELKGRQIAADDPSKIFISPRVYEKLKIKQGVLAVKNTINLVAVTVNPTSPQGFSFPPREFLEKMREAVAVPVYDVLNRE